MTLEKQVFVYYSLIIKLVANIIFTVSKLHLQVTKMDIFGGKSTYTFA